MIPICNDPTCGHHGPHLHDVNAPRRIDIDDAQDIDSARRMLMASFGSPLEPGDIPDMTIRQTDPPKGPRPMEIAQITVALEDDTPTARARFGSAVSAAIGIPGLKLVKDEAEGYRTWNIGARSILAFDAVLATWARLAATPGVTYLRLDGVDGDGLWIIDTDPEAAEPRFTVAGP